MSIKRLTPVLLSVLMLTISAGCTARQAPTPTPQGYKVTPNNIVKNVEKNVMPPKQLAVLESNAEAIITDAANRDWGKVQSRVNQIKTSFSQLKPIMQTSAVPSMTISNISSIIGTLEKQIAAKNVYETKLQANKLTQVLPDVATMYKMTVPAEIGRLGFLGREIDLNVEKGDWKAAKTNYDSARTMWNSLKTQLNSTYKTDADNFNTVLDDLGKAITDKNTAGVKTATKRMSDALAVLSVDFAKQNTAK